MSQQIMKLSDEEIAKIYAGRSIDEYWEDWLFEWVPQVPDVFKSSKWNKYRKPKKAHVPCVQ